MKTVNKISKFVNNMKDDLDTGNEMNIVYKICSSKCENINAGPTGLEGFIIIRII